MRAPEYCEDVKAICDNGFKFDLAVADNCFTGIPFIKDKMNIPVVGLGIVPPGNTSAEVAPYSLSITPAAAFAGKIKQRALHFLPAYILFATANKFMNKPLAEHSIDSGQKKLPLIAAGVCKKLLLCKSSFLFIIVAVKKYLNDTHY